jgi:putative phosphoesterase
VARAPKLRETHVRIPAKDDGTLRLAVVADTHGRPHPRALERLAALAPAAILHGGDIGDLAVLEALAEVAPVHAVRGNIDADVRDVADLATIDLVAAGDGELETRALLLRIMLFHIAVAGPRLRADAARLAKGHEADLVVCGHSHVPLVAKDRDLLVFNPGSIGPRRFTLPIVFGTIDVAPTGLRFAHHDCETGEVWRPG